MIKTMKKYSFLIMMVVTSFVYGGMRLYSLYDERLDRLALEDARKVEYVESIGEAIVEALGESDSIGDQAAGLVADAQTSQGFGGTNGGDGTGSQTLGGTGAVGDGAGTQGLGGDGTGTQGFGGTDGGDGAGTQGLGGTDGGDGTGTQGFGGTDGGDGTAGDGAGTQGLGGTGAVGDGTGSQGLGGTDGGAAVPGNGTDSQGGEVPFQRVELDYLDDALFIGDSRTDTLHLYAGWNKTDFFVKSGLSVWEVMEEVLDDGVTLDSMLSAKQYGKIYIMLGINELGSGTPKTYAEQFGVVVDHVREMQPDAVIFVGSIIHVTPNKDAENTYINNAEIDARNEELVKLTDNRSVFWIDANEVLDDPATGKLREDYAFDGVHLKAKYIPIWQEFFLNHGIVK